MITNEEARKAIEKYQKEHPLPYGTIDVTAISSKEGADIISQTIERISKQIDDDMELWCICEMAKMYMQGVRPVYPARPHGEWIAREDMDYLDENKVFHKHFECNKCGLIHDFIDGHTSQYNYCPNCGADMRKEKRDEQTAS